MKYNPICVEFPKRAAHCHHGKEILSSGDEYYTLLLDDLEKGYKRLDYCTSCWQKIGPQECKSYWRAKVPPSQKPGKVKESTYQTALRLLKEVVLDKTEEGEKEAFILALLLARKRRLLLRQELVERGETTFLYENPQTEEMFTIRRVDIPPHEREMIQEKLSKKFK